jgi:hypothetical protein
MRGLYKYPQNEYPYEKLLNENRTRSKKEPEYELQDTGTIFTQIITYKTGVFDNQEYWDVEVEYAKNTPNDVLIKVNISNRSDEESTFHFLPTFWVFTDVFLSNF